MHLVLQLYLPFTKRTAGSPASASFVRITLQRPDRRSATYDKNSGQKSTGSGALSIHPGAGYRLEQLMGDNKKQPEQAARGDHGDIEELREPGRGLFRVPEPADFPCHPRAEVLEHVFPYPWRTTGSYLNYFDGFG